MKVGDRYEALRDLDNHYKGDVVEITGTEGGMVGVDGMDYFTDRAFLQSFRPVNSSPSTIISGEDKVRLAITALINGSSVELPDGEVWIYRRQGEVVQEQGDEDIVAMRSGIFRRMTVLKGAGSSDQFFGVDMPFGYVIERLRGISDEQAALLAANLTLTKSRHHRG